MLEEQTPLVLEKRHGSGLFWHRHARAPWRRNLLFGALATFLVFSLNLASLIWILTRFSVRDTSPSVYQGSCEMSRTIVTWIELLVNILSVILVGASNNCAQLLTAPTRANLDEAHARSFPLEVGVHSIRNLRMATRSQVWCWLLLLSSAVPLHLFFNSVIISSTNANQYLAAVVTEDFVNETLSVADSAEVASSLNAERLGFINATELKRELTNYTRLSNRDCISTYGPPDLLSGWGNVVLVSSLNVTNDTARIVTLWISYPEVTRYNVDSNGFKGWMCGDWADNSSDCKTSSLLQDPQAWTLVGIPDESYQPHVGPMYNDTQLPTVNAEVQYCLAQKLATAPCGVQVNLVALGIVLVCNLVKLGCILTTALTIKSAPLVTIDDAVASFLRREDDSLLVRHSKLVPFEPEDVDLPEDDEPPKRSRLAWARACPASHWLFGILFQCCIWLAAVILFTKSVRHAPWVASLGTTQVNNVIWATQERSLISNVLLANIPQLFVTSAYLTYNDLLTRMVAVKQWTDFGIAVKPLRVSHPEGQQRSTYWFSLPYNYSIPLMVMMAFLHWAISRSIFVVQRNVFDTFGKPADNFQACGFSQLAIILALVAGLVLIIALLLISRRRLPDTMPAMRCNSVAIATASKANASEQKPWLRPLMFGFFVSDGGDETARGHAGFSSVKVRPWRSQ